MYEKYVNRTYKFFKRIIKPTYTDYQYEYIKILQKNINKNTNWLDLGCGHQILDKDFKFEELDLINNSAIVVGIDSSFQSLKNHMTIQYKINGEITQLPFRDCTFDVVSANMVVEHLNNPIQQLNEVSRILKQNGLFIFYTPNLYGYKTFISYFLPNSIKPLLVRLLEGRAEEDVFPTYYKLNSTKRIYDTAGKTRFIVKDIKMTQTGGTRALSLFIPFLIIELLWIKLINIEILSHLRGAMVAILEKV